ncbi:MAG: hypothetical protein HQM01_09160 [Magnetococcales bacterium]|nr:hypothetical protein [Magnetococcales bacterium]
MQVPGTEINYYGAAALISNQLSLKETKTSIATWTHGWYYMDVIDVSQLVYDIFLSPTIRIPGHLRSPFLVATQEQANFLKEHGFQNSHAVGLPFAYTEHDPTTERMPNSLLVMPSHSLTHGTTEHEIEYLDYIQSIAHHFSKIVFCVSTNCISNGLWIDNLDQYGFDFVQGATAMDEFCLPRLRKLFDSFEYMTSNAIGSHVLYASMCGVKVSLAGPFRPYQISEFHKQPEWGDPTYMRVMELACSMSELDFIRKKFPWYVTEPWLAIDCSEWSKQEIGFHNKRKPAELAMLFGWITEEERASLDFQDTALQLDLTDDVGAFLEFIQHRFIDSQTLLTLIDTLLARKRIRSAYILAMILANQNLGNPLIGITLTIGGLTYNNSEECQRGLKILYTQQESLPLPVKYKSHLYEQILAPWISEQISEALLTADFPRMAQLIEILHAAEPRSRSPLASFNPSTYPMLITPTP